MNRQFLKNLVVRHAFNCVVYFYVGLESVSKESLRAAHRKSGIHSNTG